MKGDQSRGRCPSCSHPLVDFKLVRGGRELDKFRTHKRREGGLPPRENLRDEGSTEKRTQPGLSPWEEQSQQGSPRQAADRTGQRPARALRRLQSGRYQQDDRVSTRGLARLWAQVSRKHTRHRGWTGGAHIRRQHSRRWPW